MAYKLITAEDLKSLTKGSFGEEYDPLLEDILIPAVGKTFAAYCHRPDFDKIIRIEYFSPRERQKRLFLSSPPIAPTLTSIRTTNLRWILSAAGAGIYYVELAAGGNPALADPSGVLQNGGQMARSATSALQPGYFWYGDADTLGFSTVYVRLHDSTDPDSKALGYVQHVAGGVRLYEDSGFPKSYSTELVSGSDFFVFDEEGIIERSTWFACGYQTLKVVYQGGYLTDDAVGAPPDLKLAATMQTAILFSRRDELGVTSRSLEGGSISLLMPTLPKSVTLLLDQYRVWSLF